MFRLQSSLVISVLLLSCSARPEPTPALGPEPVPIAPSAPSATDTAEDPAPAPPEPAASEGTSGMVPTDWTLCETPAECVLVVTTCCDQCNGGKAVAVNTKHVEDTKAMRGRCDNVACTKRGCTTQTNCAHGRCVIEP